MPFDLTHPHDRFFRRIWSRKDIARDFLAHYLPREYASQMSAWATSRPRYGSTRQTV